MDKGRLVGALLMVLLILAGCGPEGEQTPAVVTVVATPTIGQPVITVVASPTPPAGGETEQLPVGTQDVLPPAEATALPPPQEGTQPAEGFDEGAFWASFPLPPGAEVVPVVEGIDLAFTTDLPEPEVFDYYATWLESNGWSQQAPTEAMITPPHQRWRKDGAELRLEIPGLDEAGHTQVWVQVTYLTTDALPQPTSAGADILPEPATPIPTALPPLATEPPPPEVPATTEGWLGPRGGAHGTWANLGVRLPLPLSLVWEWGGGQNNPVAVVASGDRVYLLSSRGYLCLLNASDGAEQACRFLWPDEKSPASTGGWLALAGETVIVSAYEVYIEPGQRASSVRGLLAAFSQDVQPLWSMPVADELSGYEVLADQGLVVAATRGGYGIEPWLAAFDAASGAQLWQVPGNAVPAASDGTTLYTHLFSTAAASRLATGERLWEREADVLHLAYADGRLYAGSDGDVTCLDATTGQVVWHTGFGAASDLVVAHGQVYMKPDYGVGDHGYRPGVMALDIASGQERWSVLTEETMSAQALVATADAVVVIATDGTTFEDLLLVLAPNGQELDRVPLGPSAGTGLALAGDQVYQFGTKLRVYSRERPGGPVPSPTPQPAIVPQEPPRADATTINPANAGRLAQVAQVQAEGDVRDLAWAPDGRWLAISDGGKLRLYEGTTLNPAGLPREIEAGVLAFSPDGTYLAAIRQGDLAQFQIDLWRVADWTLARSLEGHGNLIADLAFSPDGRLLASASQDSSVRLWDVAGGGLLQEYKPTYTGTHPPGVLNVAFRPDGSGLVAGVYGGTVQGWRLSDGVQDLFFQASSLTQPNDVIILPNGVLVTLNSDNIRLFRADGTQFGQLESEAGVYQGDTTPDGQVLAAGGRNGVELWDLTRSELARSLEAKGASAVAFSPDGAYLATAGEQVVQLWGLGGAEGGPPVTGRYAEVWARLGEAGGPLGKPLDPPVEDTFAEQHFQRGLMHWGRWDRMGDPEREVHVIVYGDAGSNRQAGDLWGRFVDDWQEGDDQYPCPEAAPPLGPKRGFGRVWCQTVRDSLGAPLEEEYPVQASYQDFEGGTMIWSPTDGGIYVLFNRGDWLLELVD